jgi:hypothetical protein
MTAMMTADGSFLDQSCDRAASLVNPQQLRCGRASCAERWDDVTTKRQMGDRPAG